MTRPVPHIGNLGFALAKVTGLPYSLAHMNLKQNCSFFAGFLAVFALLTVTGCSTSLPYQESRDGNYLYLNPFAHKPATPEEHWQYAESLKEKGSLRSARKQYQIFTKRWPEDAKAAKAKQTEAEIYFDQGKNKKSFKAYEDLIQQYYTNVKDYDSILERQYTLATREMDRKRMRWLFGGYRAPERAVPLFESIIQNAPQWERAPEMQYMIGQAYQKNDDQELAVVAYSTVEYRYPDSPFAEKAATSKIDSFKELVSSKPYSVDIREQAQLSADMFPELYTNSQHIADVKAFGKELHGLSAEHNYEIGRFYERVPRPPQTNAAAIYYKKVIKKYGDTEYAAKAEARLRVLFPRGEAVLADGTQAPIVPVLEGGSAVAAAPAASGVDISVGAGGGSAAAVVDETPAVVSNAVQSSGGRAQVKPLPPRTVTDKDAIEITADRMEYVGKLLVGEGNVAFQQDGASLQADRVTVDPDTGEIHATGNILMIRENNRWEGQELVYNYKTREGSFGKSFMYFEPAYITAEKTERISTNEYLMTGVTMTTCSGEKPTVYAKAKEVRVLDEKKASGVFIKAKHVTFYVGPVPVFYTPIWQRHLGYRVFTFTVGYGGRLGAFIMGRAELHPTEWLTSNTHFDLYSRRGLGVGQDFDWETPSGRGGIKTYYIEDSDPTDSDDEPSKIPLLNSERYRIRLDHREQLNRQTYFATRANFMSDPDVLEDFFNDEFKAAAEPENFAVVQHATDDYAAGVRVDRRMNNFYTTVDRIPEMTYDKYRSQIGDSPFYFESENSAGFFEKLNAETNLFPVPMNDNYRSARFDTYDRIFLPLRFQDFFNVTPRAGYRGTWYSETANGKGDANYRNIFEAGNLVSFKAYRTLTEKSGFYGTGLRHTVEPYADYSWRAKPNLRPDDLHQFDSIDTLDKQNEVRFGGRNLLQTKRGPKRIANFIDSDIYTTYRYEEPSGGRSFSNLVADTEMSLTDNFFIGTDLEYEWYKHDLTPANARMKWVTDDESEYSFEYRYLDGTRSLFTPRAVLFPNDKWSYEFSLSYDGKYGEWFERKILINHKFDCVGMGTGLKMDEDDELQFWIQFWLTAFPKSKMDLGY